MHRSGLTYVLMVLHCPGAAHWLRSRFVAADGAASAFGASLARYERATSVPRVRYALVRRVHTF